MGKSTSGCECAEPQPTIDPTEFLDRCWFKGVLSTRENDLRAHKIALTYSKLADVLDDLIHRRDDEEAVKADKALKFKPDDKRQPAGTCNANWFHFATWGTLAVTRNIANERPPQRVDMLPLDSVRRWLTPVVIQARASNGQRVSRELAWGQCLMFISMCYSLAHLVEWAGANPDAPPKDFKLTGKGDQDVATMIVDLATSHRGLPHERCWIRRDRHVRPLAEALRFYLHARRTTDPVARTRCVLGGNLLLTAIEQDLVDQAVEAVVDHIPQRLAQAAEQRKARWVERRFHVPSQITSLSLPFRFPQIRATVDTVWSRLMTDQVFVMPLPTETLRLGRDIPYAVPGTPYYPPALRRLRQIEVSDEEHRKELVPVLESVADLVEAFERSDGVGRGSASRDWRRWDERMSFATTLMRSRQHDGTLYWPPYSLEDQRRIRRDELPKRSGDPSALEVQAPIDALGL
jgi:hypothetical protein